MRVLNDLHIVVRVHLRMGNGSCGGMIRSMIGQCPFTVGIGCTNWQVKAITRTGTSAAHPFASPGALPPTPPALVSLWHQLVLPLGLYMRKLVIYRHIKAAFVDREAHGGCDYQQNRCTLAGDLHLHQPLVLAYAGLCCRRPHTSPMQRLIDD